MNNRFLASFKPDPKMKDEELLWEVAKTYSDNEEHAKRMFFYMKKKFFLGSTPINANVPIINYRGAPISCFLNDTGSNTMDLQKCFAETASFSMLGGGLGTNWSNWPSSSEIPNQAMKNMDLNFYIALQGRTMRGFSGFARHIGSVTTYLHISHQDIEKFIEMRSHNAGMDPELRVPRYIHHGVVIPDEFMHAVMKNENWILKNQKQEPVKKVCARTLFSKILKSRVETGEPYIVFEDNVNKSLPEIYKKLGLKVDISNLCTEILLPTSKDHQGNRRVPVCCLGSVNLLYFDEWSKDPKFFEDIVRWLDNCLTFMICDSPFRTMGEPMPYTQKCGGAEELRKLSNKEEDIYKRSLGEEEALNKLKQTSSPLADTANTIHRERALGIGVVGYASLLQTKLISIESHLAKIENDKVFSHIKEETRKASKKLAYERGACEDAKELGIAERHVVLTAVAPTSNLSGALGWDEDGEWVSYSIEPFEPIQLKKDRNGFYVSKNKILQNYLKEKNMDTPEIWKKIAFQRTLNGILSPEEAAVFNGPYEISPDVLINLNAERYKYIDQGVSFNLFFSSKTSAKEILGAHIKAWETGNKTLYYFRGEEKSSVASNLYGSNKEEKSSVESDFHDSNEKEEIKNIPECIMCQ